MKKFEYPEVEMQIFAIEDVITTSAVEEGGGLGENELPGDRT